MHAGDAHAQAAPPALVDAAATETMPEAIRPKPQDPCDGCPKRRVGHAFLQNVIVNVFYETANLVRGQDTAKITPKTWWANMKQGWVWDLDDFTVNQIGHPYQGNNYFNTGRANGLSFWESAGLTAFGSGTWEYFGETNKASLNDLINTTLGGIALGEMFHRTAWLVRDPQANRTRPSHERDRGHRDRSGDRREPVPLGRLVARLGQAARHGADTARRAGLGRRALAGIEHPRLRRRG